jgi:hypothetical protein
LKRICLAGAAVAGLFTAGVPAVASAASSAPTKTKTVTKYKTVVKTETKNETTTEHSTVACKPSLSVAVPAGETTITQGATSGTMFGDTGCGTPLFQGLTVAKFTTGDSGDLTGNLTQYFKAGSVKGTFDILPAESTAPPTTDSFTQLAYSGTVKITGGSEAYKGVTGTGTMKCSTLDAIHYSCTSTLKLSQTVTKPVTVKVKVKVPYKVKEKVS